MNINKLMLNRLEAIMAEHSISASQLQNTEISELVYDMLTKEFSRAASLVIKLVATAK